MRAIGPDLPDAVDAMIEAAGHERTYAAQRALLRAASFGKAFVEMYDADKLVRMCKVRRSGRWLKGRGGCFVSKRLL